MLKTLDAFSFEAQPDLNRDAVLQVFDCSFVAEAKVGMLWRRRLSARGAGRRPRDPGEGRPEEDRGPSALASNSGDRPRSGSRRSSRADDGKGGLIQSALRPETRSQIRRASVDPSRQGAGGSVAANSPATPWNDMDNIPPPTRSEDPEHLPMRSSGRVITTARYPAVHSPSASSFRHFRTCLASARSRLPAVLDARPLHTA